MDKSKYDYEERAKKLEKNDYWGQVRRTVNGKAVGKDQIDLIYNQIKNNLQMKRDDNLIDIGCGNGILTNMFKEDVNTIFGIDRSKFLISVAKEKFQSQNIKYLCGEVPLVLEQIDFNNGFNKVLVYGVFSFFDNKTSNDFFNWASNNSKIKRIFIGNSRDRSLAHKFYKRSVSESELNDFKSSMGAWRTKEYFSNIANEFKWKIEFSKMPKEYYSYEYYFDVTLTRD
jgi:SAM-dependent methyltransferase